MGEAEQYESEVGSGERVMPTTLSISIVLYKNYRTAAETLKSIEKWTSPNIQKMIYLIDNSCNDTNDSEKTKFIRFIRKFDDIKYIDTGKNLGFGKGHNYVLPRLDSKYHAIVNPDILIYEDAFSKILKFMDDNYDRLGMVIPRIEDENGALQPVYRRDLTVSDMFIRMFMSRFFKERQAYHTMQEKNYFVPFQVPFGQGSFLVIKTSLFKELKGFDDRYFMYLEDADLCKRVNQQSRLVYCPYAHVVHKWERGSHKNMMLFSIHVRSMIKYFRKWGIS